MEKILLLFFCVPCFFILSAQTPINDECTGAILLSVAANSSCTTMYSADVIGATQSLAPCVQNGNYEAKDVWYKFTATAEKHSITLFPDSYTDFVFEVYSGLCDNLSSIACVNNTGINEIEGTALSNLTPGKTYFIRVFNRYAWTDIKFRLCVNSSTTFIPNDEATGAIEKPTTGTSSFAVYSNIGATLSLPACTGSASKDIWFKFIATSTRHIIRYGSAGYSSYPTAAEVFSGTPTNLASIKCYGIGDNSLDVSGLTIGNTYYYRIYISNGSSVSTDLSTYVSTPPQTPINDECTGAILLSVAANSSCTTMYSADVIGATQSLAPCVQNGNYEAKDVWYKFTATAEKHSITLFPDSYTDFVFEVYSGLCDNLSSIACVNNTGINEIEGTALSNLTPGKTYFIRVFNRYAWTDIKFRLCVNSSTTFIPNDEATGAIEKPTTGTSSFAVYSNIGATLSLPACTGSASKDIWFKFIATSTRHIIRYGSAGYSSYPTAAEVFSGTPTNLASIKCYGIGDNSLDVSGLTIGNTYYYRIYISNGSSVSTDLSTYVSTPPQTPINDECTGAILLSVAANSSCTTMYSADVIGATQSLAPCVQNGNYEAKDVWYKFTATAEKHSITLFPDSYTDFVFEVYSGLCDNLSSIACVNNTGINEIEGTALSNLTPGKTYFIRVFNRYAWTDIKFRLCVNSSTTFIPNDEATGAIEKPTTGTSSFAVYSNIGATLSLPACTGSASKDIWFKFIATSTRHIIRYGSAGYSSYPTAAEVFSGTPTNLASIKCYGIGDNSLDVSGLTIGNTYYYRIYISNGSSVSTDLSTYVSTPNVPLPLKFINFKGEKENNATKLIWEAANEENISGYEVQVSPDGILFNKLAFVNYKQNNNISNAYVYLHHTDVITFYKVLYYRIKEIDRDNNFLYSKTIAITKSTSIATNIFPNPIKNTIYISSDGLFVFDFEISDISGRTVSFGKTYNNSIDASDLKAGIYFLKLKSNISINTSFVVIKGKD